MNTAKGMFIVSVQDVGFFIFLFYIFILRDNKFQFISFSTNKAVNKLSYLTQIILGILSHLNVFYILQAKMALSNEERQ